MPLAQEFIPGGTASRGDPSWRDVRQGILQGRTSLRDGMGRMARRPTDESVG